MTAGAQTRLSLYEEFTGEHCVPCATANPGLQSLIGANASKILLLTYPSPFPAGGSLYTTYTPVVNARLAYYGVSTAPQGRLDGTMLGTGTSNAIAGHVANLTQSDITAASATASPFNMSISHVWSVTGDSVTATVVVTAPAAYTPAGASLKLRVALVEHLQFGAAPGINGEQDFPNVVRDMYPSAAGTAISGTWTMGQSVTYTVTNKVARYIDKSNTTLVAFIQNDVDRSVLQAAVSAPVAIRLDAATTGVRPASRLQCVTGTASVSSYATLRNAGTDTLRSARIYYHRDASSVLSLVNWTGSLAPGATTIVALNAVGIAGGNHYIMDSVVMPNGVIDINPGNGVGTGNVSVYNTTPVAPPILTGFEGLNGAIPTGWILYDADSNGRNFTVSKNLFGPAAGFGGSTWFLLHNNYFVPAGETNYAILPANRFPGGGVALTFSYAHAQYNTEDDKLDVVYSTDCGGSWTSVWNASGSALSTAPPTTDYFVPTAAQWMTKNVDLSGIPNGAMIAFRAISDYGNTLYIDNIRLESITEVGAINAVLTATLYPNPSKGEVVLDFYLNRQEAIYITVTDAAGRIVHPIASGPFPSGPYKFLISTDELPAGFYNVCISGQSSRIVKPLTVIH